MQVNAQKNILLGLIGAKLGLVNKVNGGVCTGMCKCNCGNNKSHTRLGCDFLNY